MSVILYALIIGAGVGAIIWLFYKLINQDIKARNIKKGKHKRTNKNSKIKEHIRPFIDELFDLVHSKLQRETFRSFRLTDKMVQDAIADRFDAYSIYRIVIASLRYLGIPDDNFIVRLEVDNDSSFITNDGLAGQYINNQLHNEINIILKQSFTFIEIIAIICHECTHHYLRIRRLGCDDEEKNEALTDIAAIYLGFGHYISKGYKSRYKKTADGYIKSKLGYINSKEIERIKQKINSLRNNANHKLQITNHK